MYGQFELVKQYLYEMELPIVAEDKAEELVVVEDLERGINNLVIDCEAPIVILEQVILELQSAECDIFKRLLQMNRSLVHGAFVLDESGKTVLFRDTLQLENLDRNELEGSIQALGLALAEYSAELLTFAGK
jgi:hypothetical protein